MASSSPEVKHAPVGLLGLQIRIGARARRHHRLEHVEVGAPSALCFTAGKRPRPDAGAEPPREPGRLHVVRHHHDHIVTRLDQVAQHDAVGLGAAIGDLDVIGGRARVHRGDDLPQLHGAVGLRVAQRLAEKRQPIVLRVGEILEAQGVHAAFREVPGHAVLPRGLQAFHRERFEPHGAEVYMKRLELSC